MSQSRFLQEVVNRFFFINQARYTTPHANIEMQLIIFSIVSTILFGNKLEPSNNFPLQPRLEVNHHAR